MDGLFLTLEGPDGSGKTTALHKALAVLKKEFPVLTIVISREPGGTAIAEKIRHVILDPANELMDNRTEALLYAAARRQHICEVILPHLRKGHIIISDRYVDSSIVYQGVARHIGVEAVKTLNYFATEGLTPARTFYFDLDPEIGLKRIKKAGGDRPDDRLEKEKLAFHKEVRKGYLTLAKENPDRIFTIDASRSVAQVQEDLYNELKEMISSYMRKREKA